MSRSQQTFNLKATENFYVNESLSPAASIYTIINTIKAIIFSHCLPNSAHFIWGINETIKP